MFLPMREAATAKREKIKRVDAASDKRVAALYLETNKQYAIDSVPTTVIADNLGVVQYGVLGPITATDLWAAMARCRDPKVLTD